MIDNTTKRIDWVDAAKGVGILLVVYGHNHLKDNLNIYIYAFHMPLFFILAGYTLSTKRTLLDFIVQKAKVLLIPYISFAFYNIIFYGVLSVTHGGEYNILDESMAFVFEQGDNYLWFLLVLFLSNIIVFVIGKSGLLNNTTMGGDFDNTCRHSFRNYAYRFNESLLEYKYSSYCLCICCCRFYLQAECLHNSYRRK